MLSEFGGKWSFEGFADFIGKKNHGVARQALAQPQLRLDLGDFWDAPYRLFVGIEYHYWHNKFGIKGLHDHVPQALLVWKFRSGKSGGGQRLIGAFKCGSIIPSSVASLPP